MESDIRRSAEGARPIRPRLNSNTAMDYALRLLLLPCSPVRQGGRRRARAFTLIEILVTLAILGVLGVIAMPAYKDYRERLRVAEAVTDIGAIQTQIKQFIDDNRTPPDGLAQVGQAGKLDPWGNPYQYLNLANARGNGQARKNRNLVPLNSDFDLYSMGKDGASSGPLTAKDSRDDVVRANDGRFIGLAKEYDP